MSNPLQDGMAEATRLTREGRLAEATAVIQRTLGGAYPPAFDASTFDAPAFAPALPPDGPGGADEPVEAPPGAAKESPRPNQKTDHALRRAPGGVEGPPRPFRGMSWAPGNLGDLLGNMPGSTLDAPEPAVVPAGGRFVDRSYTNSAGTRAYKLYVPSGYVGQEVPLVVMLHGCTQNPDNFATGTHMNALAEAHAFLVAYPAQATGANVSGCWNWFEAADQQRGRGEPSIIAGITREVAGEHNVAAGRVYLAGMSAGGAMAAIVGAAYPDLYAAIGVHSGLAPGAARDLSSAFAAMRRGGPGGGPNGAPPIAPAADGKPKMSRIVPTIVFHGDRDTTVHPSNADRLISYWTASDRGVPGDPALLAAVRRGQVPGGYSYSCATHQDAAGRAVMEQWTVHGLGHAWSGGSVPGSYTDPKGPDASAEMVRFFQQHLRR